MTPADLLRAAATKLREAAHDAVKASPLPWFIKSGAGLGPGVIYSDEYSNIVADRSCDQPEDAIDLPYIALMHPGVGTALAAWLDSAAEDAEQIGPDPHALAVARAVLGEVTE